MNTTTHEVAPEEVMAYLDGELAAEEEHAVAKHLEECGECALVAEHFRDTSRLLTGWSVAEVPDCVERQVMGAATEAPLGGKSQRRKTAYFGWKGWTFAGSVAALGVLLVVTTRNLNHANVHRAMVMNEASPAAALHSYNGQLALQDFKADGGDSAPPAVLTARAARSSDGLTKGAAGVIEPQGPMIARTASVEILVKSVVAARSPLDELLVRHHGYIANLNAYSQEGSGPWLTASLRVPARELDAALTEIKTLGRVQSETRSGEEVTRQYADLAARLQNARETEGRYRAILEQRTGKVGDILEVEQEISRVRGEIESMEAEQKMLEHRVDFASIEVRLSERYTAQLSAPAGALTRLGNAFVAGYRNATETLMGFMVFAEEYGPSMLIWLVVLGWPGYLVWRRYRRMYSRM